MCDILREHGVEFRLGLVDEDAAAYESEATNELEFSEKARTTRSSVRNAR